jgi:hypothetical protein
MQLYCQKFGHGLKLLGHHHNFLTYDILCTIDYSRQAKEAPKKRSQNVKHIIIQFKFFMQLEQFLFAIDKFEQFVHSVQCNNPLIDLLMFQIYIYIYSSSNPVGLIWNVANQCF